MGIDGRLAGDVVSPRRGLELKTEEGHDSRQHGATLRHGIIRGHLEAVPTPNGESRENHPSLASIPQESDDGVSDLQESLAGGVRLGLGNSL